MTLRDAPHADHSDVLTYRSYVGGKDIDSGRHIYTVSAGSILDDVFESLTLKRRLEQGRIPPEEADHRVVGRCALADEETVAAASFAAAEAAREWARVPHERRMALGPAIRRRIAAGCDAMIDVLIAEGTPRALAEWQVAGLLETFSEKTLSWVGGLMHREFRHGPRRLVVRRCPDGVVCVNPPQNAPAASALFGATALLAGNAVIVRAPRSAPLGVMHALREFVVPALEETGAPAGVLSVLCGRPGPVLRHWLDSPYTDDILYIGSTEHGLALQEKCIRHGKKPILELAGNDCVVVWRDADLDAAAEALSECFYGSGQICMVPNQVLVHPAVADALLEKLTAAARLRPGYPDEEGVLLSPVLRSERFFAFVKDALDHGARVVHGARRLETDGSPSDTGLFLEPTVLRVDGLGRARNIEAVRRETFFPLLPVIVPESGDDAELLDLFLEYVNSNPYGLRNSVWAAEGTEVLPRFERETVNGGLLKLNDSHIGFLPYLPTHGGTGLTGGVLGEANYPMLRTSHLQGVSAARGVRPREAVFGAFTALRDARGDKNR